ncbi:hypothetical protein HK101_007254 [Irineochytrium annulatum]|nr:hypothetical protein HK101_007254 [Irineochytrium annulatum]
MTYPQYPQPAMQQPQFYVQQQQQFPQQPYGQNPQQPYAQGQPLYAPPASDFGTYHTGSSEPTPPSSMMSEQVPAGYQQQQGVFYGQTNPYGHA